MTSVVISPKPQEKYLEPGCLVIHGGEVVLVVEGESNMESTFCGISVGRVGDGLQEYWCKGRGTRGYRPRWANNWSKECFHPFIGEVLLIQK